MQFNTDNTIESIRPHGIVSSVARAGQTTIRSGIISRKLNQMQNEHDQKIQAANKLILLLDEAEQTVKDDGWLSLEKVRKDLGWKIGY